jgi:hypothetical protein
MTCPSSSTKNSLASRAQKIFLRYRFFETLRSSRRTKKLLRSLIPARLTSGDGSRRIFARERRTEISPGLRTGPLRGMICQSTGTLDAFAERLCRSLRGRRSLSRLNFRACPEVPRLVAGPVAPTDLRSGDFARIFHIRQSAIATVFATDRFQWFKFASSGRIRTSARVYLPSIGSRFGFGRHSALADCR